MSRYLTILEVSQKQAYIFASNKLQDNVRNSAVIAWVMSPDYFQQIMKESDRTDLFDAKENLVYSGGGHIVLEFASKDNAEEFVKIITRRIRIDYPGIEVFATTSEFVEVDKDGNKVYAGENIKLLTAKLEKKKAERKAAFHQGSFGVEKIDSNTLKPVLLGDTDKAEMPKAEEEIDRMLSPDGFRRVSKFGELGGSKNQSNFIAVVHIDGNAMGKRVEKLYQTNKDLDWPSYKEMLGQFSKAIDDDFKAAYKDMADKVALNIGKGRLKDLKLKNDNFPIRRIITAGDDICFVSEGRIGIECATEFIKALNQKVNSVDKEGYAACAGVAIVHQKYPFYKAYELAEMLCDNAKRFGASLSADKTGSDISAIDWHIEFGEIKDTLDDIRKDYDTLDGNVLNLRPYIVSASTDIISKEAVRQYSYFKQIIDKIMSDEFARGKLKELRSVLKKGQKETQYYLKFNKINNLIKDVADGDSAFVETSDKMTRSLLFDAIEMVDTYIGLE